MSDSDNNGRRDLSSVLPLRVNEEAVVFRGCTTTEIVLIVTVSAAFWLAVTAFIGAIVGKMFLFIGFSLFLVLITTFILATIFQRVKRGEAPGHYQHLVSLLFASVKMKRSPFITVDGPLSIGRTEQIVLIGRHLGINDHQPISERL